MSRTYAIGDIHGCLDKLTSMLERIEAYQSGGKVVFLGDYVDRGPDSAGVISLLMAGPQKPGWEWVALKGNHEDMMVTCTCGENPLEWWLGNGGVQTMASYGGEIPKAHLAWCEALPLIHVDEHRIYAHAGVDESVPLEEQIEQTLLWSRKPPHYSGDYWGKHLVHGHTPSDLNPAIIGNRTNLDSGAVFGGKLSCAVFIDDEAGSPMGFIQT
jgi:serine/threonine protein phosphatase 1